jgi:cell division protein FtsB
MINGNLRRAFPYRLILSVLMGVVLLYLAANFVKQTGDRLDLRDRLRHIEQEIAATEKANSELKARLDYVSSDDAAEEWARENGWARSDEVLVVVLAPETETAQGVEVSPKEGAGPDSSRDSWWDLFFGER